MNFAAHNDDASQFLPLVFRPFGRVLIANRGEIAVRIIRACRDLGLSPLAVFSDPDSTSRHVAMADEAFCLGGATSAESYLNIDKIIEAALQLGAEAIHPGFGFLSENAEFANAVLKAGMVWIGPSPQSIALMGNKTLAKQTVIKAGVPCCPGQNTPLQGLEDLKTRASDLGFPLILKAVSGGGGRGMRVVRKENELAPALAACEREALGAFGNPDVFCERFIERPRHVEFQILADKDGHTVHLFERDCTIQRRHQKLIEEAPSGFLDPTTRALMGECAIQAAKSVGYVNAGTVEFLLESPTRFYFMEMNTRIQVEHPVTEAITGIDLVQTQMNIAMGAPLPFRQQDISVRGWALEARVNAEDPTQDFRPAPGLIRSVEFPAGPGVRVDSHVYSGYQIPQFYDSMLAKLIVHGSTRADAIRKMKRALGEFYLDGVPTTIPYHQALLECDAFCQGNHSTRFVEENELLLAESAQRTKDLTTDEALAVAVKINAESGLLPKPTVKQAHGEESQWTQAHRRESVQ